LTRETRLANNGTQGITVAAGWTDLTLFCSLLVTEVTNCALMALGAV